PRRGSGRRTRRDRRAWPGRLRTVPAAAGPVARWTNCSYPGSVITRTRPTQEQLLEWTRTLSNWGRWGPDDQPGTLNLITPEVTRRALALVSEGASVSCARRVTYDAAVDVPLPPQHYMLASGDPYRPGEGPDRQVARDYFGMVFHGHAITHIDSLAHFFWDGQLYNGVSSRKVSTAEGATSHSIDAAKTGIVTRGVLVDAAFLRGVEVIQRGDGVGLDDVEQAESRCG